ncbi:MAG: hypothetical protein JSS41_09540 [Proteobacteria bacterium]|nr:hypothetical protein [Pseudomonadota bacterium]
MEIASSVIPGVPKKRLTHGIFTLRQAGRALQEFALCTARNLSPCCRENRGYPPGRVHDDFYNILIYSDYSQVAKMPPIAAMARHDALAQSSRGPIAQVYPQTVWIKKNT